MTFLVAAVLVFHLTGALAGLLAGLTTLTGLALFAALWATTTWSTGRALRGVYRPDISISTPIGAAAARALRSGDLNGVLFLAATAVILALTALLSGQGTSLFVFIVRGLVFATVGTLAAAMIGAVLGLVFAAIDLAQLWTIRRLLIGNDR